MQKQFHILYTSEMNKKNFFLLLFISILMAGAFYLGKHNMPKLVIQRQYDTSPQDSLGVYRITGTENYISLDSSIQVTIRCIQLGREEVFHQLKLSTDNNVYYGYMDCESGDMTGDFIGTKTPTHIQFFEGIELDGDNIVTARYLTMNDKKIPLKEYDAE